METRTTYKINGREITGQELEAAKKQIPDRIREIEEALVWNVYENRDYFNDYTNSYETHEHRTKSYKSETAAKRAAEKIGGTYRQEWTDTRLI